MSRGVDRRPDDVIAHLHLPLEGCDRNTAG
jgi:hypothetical protein